MNTSISKFGLFLFELSFIVYQTSLVKLFSSLLTRTKYRNIDLKIIGESYLGEAAIRDGYVKFSDTIFK